MSKKPLIWMKEIEYKKVPVKEHFFYFFCMLVFFFLLFEKKYMKYVPRGQENIALSWVDVNREESLYCAHTSKYLLTMIELESCLYNISCKRRNKHIYSFQTFNLLILSCSPQNWSWPMLLSPRSFLLKRKRSTPKKEKVYLDTERGRRGKPQQHHNSS